MKKHCCKMMTDSANRTCSEHPSPYDCPDCLIVFNKKDEDYGLIIHDGGSSYIEISFCPWCGKKL